MNLQRFEAYQETNLKKEEEAMNVIQETTRRLEILNLQ